MKIKNNDKKVWKKEQIKTEMIDEWLIPHWIETFALLPDVGKS